MIKKIAAVAGVISTICFAALLVNYLCNEHTIKNYENGIYKISSVNSVLGFSQPYIYHYNKGNMYYKQGDYSGAEEEYRKALESHLPGEKDCKVRINMALSMVSPIDAGSVTKENLDETIEILENAKKVLTENGCAHEKDENGHNKDAQTLKDEIDDFENQLRKKVEEQDKQDDTENNKKDPDTDKEKKDDVESNSEDEIKRQLQDIQGDGLKERNTDMDTYETYKNGYSYYDGATW